MCCMWYINVFYVSRATVSLLTQYQNSLSNSMLSKSVTTITILWFKLLYFNYLLKAKICQTISFFNSRQKPTKLRTTKPTCQNEPLSKLVKIYNNVLNNIKVEDNFIKFKKKLKMFLFPSKNI